MKTYVKLKALSILMFFVIGSATIEKMEAQKVVTITYQTFYDTLLLYGIWIDYPGYGHVWHPSIDGNFRPYFSNGYWEYCNDGWIWISLYEWGWAPFHYGRWLYDDLYGWLWVPGYEWAPAWVIWGEVDDYYAWAPLTPSVNVVIWFGTWRPAIIYWNVVSRTYIYDRDISRRGRSNLDDEFIGRIIINDNHRTTRVYNQYYAVGPDVKEVEKFTDRKIIPISVRDVKKTGPATRNGNELNIYRPTIKIPEPRSYRNIDRVNPTPVRTNTDRINTDRTQQKRNVEQLPVRRTQKTTPSKRSTKRTSKG